MRKLLKYILFFISIFPVFALAKVDLVTWQSAHNAPRIILPVLENETPEQAVFRYLNQLKANFETKNINEHIQNLKIGKVDRLQIESMSGKTRMAFIANWFQDLTPEGARIQRNIKIFKSAGADPYVIGLSADLGLNSLDADNFRQQIVENFSLLVSLGGDDIAPEIYNEAQTFSKKSIPTRDKSEYLLVKKFKSTARGLFFGICRGHQMGAIADGHKLNQDLTQTKAGTTDYHIQLSGTNSTEMQTWHGIDINVSLLSRFLKNQKNLIVNSVHHQSVQIQEQGQSMVIATDDKDHGVEALQSKNNKSLSVQFHPEFPPEISLNKTFSRQGFQIIKGIVSYARLIRQNETSKSCSQYFNN